MHPSSNLECQSSRNMPPDSFFSQYAEFDHDPTAPLVLEFQRLSLQRGWKAGGKTYRRNRQECLTQEFEHHYGHASDKLAGWQALCADVHISPAPSSINQCKKAGRASHRLGGVSEVANSSPRLRAGTLENRRQPGRPDRFPPHGGTGEGFPFEDRAAELFHQAEQDFPEEEGEGGWVPVCALDRDFLEGLSISGSRGS